MERSPITLNNNIDFLYELDSNKVIDLYKKEFNVSVNRFFKESKIKFYKCKTTDLVFVGGLPHIAGDGAFYENLAPKSNSYYNNEKWEFDAVINLLEKDLKVLDIGCGDGHFLSKLHSKKITGIGLELNKQAIKTCLNKGLSVYEKRIEDFAIENPNAFDAVCSFQVFEHLERPLDIIKASIQLTKPGGLLVISVPNNNSNIFKLDPYHTLNLPPHHVLFWDENSLEKTAKYFNLEVVKIIKSPLTKETRGHLYLLILKKYFPQTIAKILFTTTNWFMKRIIRYIVSNSDGSTVIAILRKR